MYMYFHGKILDHMVISVSQNKDYFQILKRNIPARKNTANARSLILKIKDLLYDSGIGSPLSHVIALPNFDLAIHHRPDVQPNGRKGSGCYYLFHHYPKFVGTTPEGWGTSWNHMYAYNRDLYNKATRYELGLAIPAHDWRPTRDWRPKKLKDL